MRPADHAPRPVQTRAPTTVPTTVPTAAPTAAPSTAQHHVPSP